jgi:Glu-tRNA(Gln) amidotransferase subunit E-like FAD-binding protein
MYYPNMPNLEDFLQNKTLEARSVEEEKILNEFVTILTGLEQESKAGRNFSGDDINDLLIHLADTKFAGTQMAETLNLFGEAVHDAQHSINRSIEEKLQALLKTDLPNMQRSIFRQILAEPRLYTWIKTNSV